MRDLRHPTSTSKGTAFSVEPRKECQATETSTFLAEVSEDQSEVESTFHRIESTSEGPITEQDISSPGIKSNKTMKAEPGKIQTTSELKKAHDRKSNETVKTEQATSEECQITQLYKCIDKFGPDTTPDGEIWPLESIDAKITSVGSWLDQLRGKT